MELWFSYLKQVVTINGMKIIDSTVTVAQLATTNVYISKS
jgi:hypothetical protein